MKLPAQPNQSLIDGMAVLQALAMESRGIGSRELARQLGLEPTRTNRLLKTLAHLGLAEQGGDRRYRSGPGIHILAAQSLYASGLLRNAMGPLRSLVAPGHVVALGVRWRDQVCYLVHAGAGKDPETGLGGMGLYPVAESSVGRCLLAWAPASEVHELEEQGRLVCMGSAAGVEKLLAQIRRNGFAEVSDGKARGHLSLAVPVASPPVAAIAVAGIFRKTEIPAQVDRLKRVAEMILTREQGAA